MRSGKVSIADPNYAEAWRDLSRDGELLDLRDDYFSNPVRVSGRQLSSLRYAPKTRGKEPDSLSDGYVLIRYTVKSNGRVEDVQVVESDPPGIMDKALVSTFSRSVFRPRREDGFAVVSERQLYQLDFLYSRKDRSTKDDRKDGPLEYPDDDRNGSGDTGGGGRLPRPEKASD
jgi:TonB family protein